MIKYNDLTKEIILVKGDSGFLAFRFSNFGEEYTLAETDSIELKVVDKDSKEAVLTKSATDGSNVIAFNPEDTEDLPKNSYKYFISVVTDTNAKYTFSLGEFTLLDVGGRI